MLTIPFTYLIYCRPLKKYYYGVRFAKGCKPSDLWNIYFTSSSYVKEIIKEYGKESFDVEVRKIFKDVISAKNWESKFLLKIKASKRQDFINECDFLFDTKSRKWVNNGVHTKFIDEQSVNYHLENGYVLGRLFSDKHKEKISSNAKQRYKNPENNPMFGKKQTNESIDKMRIGLIGNVHYCKINKEQVKEIIDLYISKPYFELPTNKHTYNAAFSQKISSKYNVTNSTICNIIKGKTLFAKDYYSSISMCPPS